MTFGVVGNEHALGQARLPLHQRTDAVGQRFGQHGNHFFGQVDARSPLEGLPVPRGAIAQKQGEDKRGRKQLFDDEINSPNTLLTLLAK